MRNEQWNIQQAFRTGKRTGLLVLERGARIVWRRQSTGGASGCSDPEIPASEHRCCRREQLRMSRGDQPGAMTTHRFSGEIHAVLIDFEALLCELETTQDVAFADARVLRIASAVRFNVDRCMLIRDDRVSLVRGPPLRIGRVGRIEAVQKHHERPTLSRGVFQWQIGPAELRRAIDVIDIGEAHEAAGAHVGVELRKLHEWRLQLCGEVCAISRLLTVGDHFSEHPHRRTPGILGRCSGGLLQLAHRGFDVSLVPGQIRDLALAPGVAGRQPQIVRTVSPCGGIERD